MATQRTFADNIRALRAKRYDKPESLISQLAHVKRFLELTQGDAEFRLHLSSGADPERLALGAGLSVDPDCIRPLWDTRHQGHPIDADFTQKWPLAAAWLEHMTLHARQRDEMLAAGDPGETHPKFSAWRARQMSRLSLELGRKAKGIVHAIAAYELCDGCSVGCWFCGVAASKFKGPLPYNDETAQLWSGILKAMKARFGAAAQTGFCYWGTDPVDNPDYARFIEAHARIVGFLPQTTTALPVRDPQRIREILRLCERYDSVVTRFSVLSTKILRQVFNTYSPEELFDVEIVSQQRGAATRKAIAGKAREKPPRAQRGFIMTEGTIACVSGFLVNVMTRTIRLITPTMSSERWPNGYRVLGERRFEDAADFASAIDQLVETHMADRIAPSDIVRFDECVSVERIMDGFALQAGERSIQMSAYGALAELICRGDKTLADLASSAEETGADFLQTSAFVDGVFRAGVLDERTMARACEVV